MGAINTVGSLLSVLGAATAAVRTVDNAINVIGGIGGRDDKAQKRADDLALRQLRETQAAQEQKLAQDNALDRQKMAVETAQAEEDRRQSLRRAVARQRAQFGSQGVGANGGSAEAVLLGLFDESDEERAKREQLDNLRTRALDLGAAQTRSLNVLQATQLAERQRLERLG